MKKYLILLAIIIIIVPTKIKAVEMVNQNGVVIPSDTYHNLKKIFTEARIDVMSKEEYNNILAMDLNYNKIKKEVKYYKTYYDHLLKRVVNKEITKEEYDKPISRNNQINETTIYETTYKRLESVYVEALPGINFLNISLVWKIIPLVKSFDVIGTHFVHQSSVGGTVFGHQIYRRVGNSNYETILYSDSGTNIKDEDNGVAYSMNLVNYVLEYLECDMSLNLSVDYYPTHTWTSYQHAIEDVTLAQSKNYDFDCYGLGYVFDFNNNIGSKYDGSGGIHHYQTASSF